MNTLNKSNILFLIISFLILSTYSAKSQDNYNLKSIYDAKVFIFFGYDFSHFKLAEGGRIGQGDKIASFYVPEWINYYKKHINYKLLKWFKKDGITFNFDCTTKINRNVNPDNIISTVKFNLPADSIQGIINNYDLIEKSGIGLTVIIECFVKETRTSSAYYVFFDIATKKIIASDFHANRFINGQGLTAYWGTSMYENFNTYIEQIYRKKYKEINKKI